MRPGGGDESEERKESEEVLPSQKEPGFVPPLSRAEARVTKKPFGILITPETSPVQPERFRGYHTGTDFEILAEEGEADVAVEAICTGPVLLKQWVSGYGGVVVQRCLYEQEPLTVLYGHLRLMSVERVVGEELSSGETIGVLGTGGSEETDGERRHLHLGMHRGSAVNMRGYVGTSSELGAWLNPCELLRFRP